MKKKSISIFGVTGSVGSSTIELLRQRKDEFEVIWGTDGKVIYIYQTYRKYNKRVRVFYKYNDTYDPNYAKA